MRDCANLKGLLQSRMKLLKSVSGTVLLAFGIVSSGYAQEPVRVDVKLGPAAETINDELVRRAKDGMNGAILVEKDGQVVLKAGYGWANRAEQVPFSSTTIAQVGSLTKQFTAAAIVDLSVRKKLRFTDPITKYLKGVPPPAQSITIHQLLTHTAGLVENCGPDFERLTRAEMISRCLVKVKPPGQFLYSNLGYSVLAAVVESVTHKRIETYLSERFFKPLGMNSSGYFFPNRVHGRMAVGYSAMGINPPISDTLKSLDDAFWNLKGNGGIQASVDDMYVWYRALTQGSIITSTMRKTLTTPYVSRDAEVKYGYGWFIRTRPDGQVEQVSHSGSDEVFLAVFVWRPLERSFFYFVTNNRDKGGADVGRTVLGILKKYSE
jgi:CubicO group peptidase (beta-lactamase class C family)